MTPAPSAPPSCHLCPATRQVGAQSWVLLEPFTYTDARPYDVLLKVPRGFVYDSASVPRPLWSAVASPTDFLTCAPLLHDALYRAGGRLKGTWPRREYTRAEADALFRDVARAHGVPAWRVWLGYLGVRLGGWVAWRRYARERA